MKEIGIRLLGIVGLYLAPIQTMMILIGVFIIIDTIMGVWSAAELAKKEGKSPRSVISSRKLRDGFLSKIIIYQTSLILLFVLDSYFLNDIVKFFFKDLPITFIITKILGVMLIVIEATSIEEKIYRVKGVKLSELILNNINKMKKLYLEMTKKD
jgi:hypothetical protein